MRTFTGSWACTSFAASGDQQAVCDSVDDFVREPDAGKPPVRFDERDRENGAWPTDIAPQTGKP